MKLKNILQSLIDDRGITITHLSKKTKIPAQTIHNWLAGAEPRGLTQVKALADYFGVSVDYLCFGKIPEINNSKSFNQYEDEINTGVFEVILRRVKTHGGKNE